MEFYTRTIQRLLRAGAMQEADSVLAVCAGTADAEVMARCGLRNVTISNLAERFHVPSVNWSRQDAEALTFPDASFDWTIVHAGLHHCASPHRALLEMYRVARKGAIVFEARDSLLMRLAVRLGITPEFELEAVVLEGGNTGGVRNSAVPNFIYRWTEREVIKTLESAHPEAVHRASFFHGLQFPEERIALTPLRHVAWLIKLIARSVEIVIPKQCNALAFVIEKTGELKPWMDATGTRIRPDYKLGFDPALAHGAKPSPPKHEP